MNKLIIENNAGVKTVPSNLSYWKLVSNEGILVWFSEDHRNLEVTVNTTIFNSASSTSYSDGTYVFNGFNEGFQDPAQVQSIDLGSGHILIAWAIDNWKQLDNGRWNSDYDLFYRVLDTTSGEFLSDEIRLTNSFESDYFEKLISAFF